MSSDDNLNRDLFGNVVPDRMVPEVEEGYSEKPEKFFFENEKANVPKFTAVKEGQEHPMGKNGQYKLFHEHQWPKGYTPERLAEVRENLPTVVNRGNSQYAPGEATAKIADHLARSTMPIEDIKALKESNMGFAVGTNLPKGTAGAFTPLKNPGEGLYPGVNLPKKAMLKPEVAEEKPELVKKLSDVVKVNTGNAVVHETGHAMDFLGNPDRFNREQPSSYDNEGTTISARPRNEGRAEGYRRAHHRATRAMRRSKAASVGYESTGFSNIAARMMYRAERQAAYDREVERAKRGRR